MIVSRPESRAVRRPVTPSYFFSALRALLSARFGVPVYQERSDERGELWSMEGLLIALDILSVRQVAIIMMDGSRPDYRPIRMDEPGLREAVEHVMELSSRNASAEGC